MIRIIFMGPDDRVRGIGISRRNSAAGTSTLTCGVDKLLENTLSCRASEPRQERPCDRVRSGGVGVLHVDGNTETGSVLLVLTVWS